MINGESPDCEPYSIPYQEETSGDPSFEEMRVLIVEKQRRPEIPSRWSKSKVHVSIIFKTLGTIYNFGFCLYSY
jgi:hypothetical protein